MSHLQRTVPSDPTATRWHVVVDNPNTHCSQSLVRYVAAVSGVTDDLGEKERHGILRSLASPAAFLAAPSHKVVVHYTPKHASWLNHVEHGLSILVRKLLRRGNFTSVQDLRAKFRRSSTTSTPPWPSPLGGPTKATRSTLDSSNYRPTHAGLY